MRLKNLFLILLLSLTSGSFALAQEPGPPDEIVLLGDLYARSSFDFRKESQNILYTIPKGSAAKVLEVKKLKQTGAYGVKVRIKSLAEEKKKNLAKIDDEVWLYYSQKDPWLTFQDAEGNQIQDPEKPLLNFAKSTGSIENSTESPQYPTREEVQRLQNLLSEPSTEAGTCTVNCSEKDNYLSKFKVDVEELKKTADQATKNKGKEFWDRVPQVAEYSENDQVKKSIAFAMSNKPDSAKKLCYRYVKRALLGGGLVKNYPEGINAIDGLNDLAKEGFSNMLANPRYKDLIKGPEDAPKGAILIYKNTEDPKKPGHIEIKTDWGENGGYVSDFFRPTSRPLINRQLVGVMIKDKQ